MSRLSSLLKKPIPLSEIDIEMMMKRAKINNFLGYFARDDLPKQQLKPKQSIIFNLDKASGEGTHWTACYHGGKSVEYFDSYGIICPPEIRKYLKKSNKNMVYSTNEIQNLNSILCGFFCVLYIILRHRGVDKYDIVYSFGMNNNKSNDNHVLSSLKNLLNL